MLRGLSSLRLCLVRITNNKILLHQTAKCSSTSSILPVLPTEPTKLKEQSSEKDLTWVQSPLDQKIYAATDVDGLLCLLENEKFNPRTAANFVSVLSKWVEDGKLEVSQFQKISSKNKLEDSLCSKTFQMKTFGILQVIDIFLVYQT